ncbi:MAG: class I SAM-dependent methyltransferase [Thermoplasmata archaeon]
MSTRTPPSPSLSRSSWKGAVRTGWNRVSYRYRPWGETSDCFGHREREYRAWLDPIVRSLPRHAKVLDLGCGTGVPAARLLSRRFRVTGVDLSDVQIRRARRLVAGATFLRADMCDVDFAPGTFAAVVSLYSLIHVPREQHRALLRKITKWLPPGGWFLAILGHARYEGSEAGWLGSDARMYWSHYDAATYRRWLRAEGFRVVREKFIPEGDGGHQLFLARKKRSGPKRRVIVPT